MAEQLTTQDVEDYTGGRLANDAPETLRLLNDALAGARHYCGWHVSPVLADVDLTLDGPGGFVLAIPTLKLTEITDLVENGIPLDATSHVTWSQNGLVRKQTDTYGWGGARWTHAYAGIVATITHGFTAAEAPDFREAVLMSIDRLSTQILTGGQREQIGPFVYGATSLAAGTAFSADERARLDNYRLERVP